MVMQTDEGKYAIYALDSSVTHIPKLTPGLRVRVISAASDTEAAPTALAIDMLPPRQGLVEPQFDPVPVDLRQLEANLEKQAKRYHFGGTMGMALDPEMLSLNGFATLTPFSGRGFNFRPGLELAFGEITSLLGLHFDFLYTLPGVKRSTKWGPYIGAGPNFSLSHRGVEQGEFLNEDQALNGGNNNGNTSNGDTSQEDEIGRFDFSQFDWNNGFDFIIGAKTPSGAFFEMKATAWGVSSIRMLGGFVF
jgi:hypothetical protein